MRNKEKPDNFTEEEVKWIEQKVAEVCIEEGDCLIWPRAMHQCSPVLMLPTRFNNKKQVRIRRVLLSQAWKKRRMGKDYHPMATCNNPRCLAKEHQAWRPFSEIVKSTAERTGWNLSLTARRRMSEGRAKHRKLTWDQVLAARAGADIGKIAKEAGVSRETVRLARVGATYKNYTGVWAGLMR